jgi:N-acetylated-alpha-linked acidic dipeptidase
VGGAYHTSYDDYAYYTRFVDPGFKYGRAEAQLNGSAVFELSSADVLPMQFDATAEAIGREVASVKRLYETLLKRVNTTNSAIADGAYQTLRDPLRPLTPPTNQSVPALDFSLLDSATSAVTSAAQRFMSAQQALNGQLSHFQVRRINLALLQVERAFNRPSGMPGRPYYKNELYSPGRLWDTVPFPAIGDAMLDGHWDVAREQIPLAANTVQQIAKAMDAAAAQIVSASSKKTH